MTAGSASWPPMVLTWITMAVSGWVAMDTIGGWVPVGVMVVGSVAAVLTLLAWTLSSVD